MNAPFMPFIPSADPGGSPPLTADEILALQNGAPTSSAIRGMPAVAPNMLARLFGGGDPLEQGLLSPTQANQFGRQSLLDTGLAILAASGPSPYRRGIGEILAQGLQAGRAGYQQRFGQEQAVESAVGQHQAAQAMNALRAKYAGKSDLDSLTSYMHDLIGLGTPEALAGARALSEYLKSQQDRHTLSFQRGLPNPNGPGYIMQGFDTQSGLPVGPAQPDKMPPDPEAAVSARADAADVAAFRKEQIDTPKLTDVVASYRRFGAILHQAVLGNPQALTSVASAFASSADPKDPLRLGMLQYFSKLSPDAQGALQNAFAAAAHGTIPLEVLQNLDKVATETFQAARQNYSDSRDTFLARVPNGRRHIPTVEELFGQTASPSAGSARERLRRAAGGRR